MNRNLEIFDDSHCLCPCKRAHGKQQKPCRVWVERVPTPNGMGYMIQKCLRCRNECS